jgi:antitoxin (DNA-binding transcriptional repressor) of toxin-antitoxin stability system
MLETISLEEAQSSLPSIIERLQPGSEIVITRNHLPVATLQASKSELLQPRLGLSHKRFCERMENNKS